MQKNTGIYDSCINKFNNEYMFVIKKNKKNVTLLFPDGQIKENQDFDQFILGNIIPPDKNTNTELVGYKGSDINGLPFTVIKCINEKDCTIRFDNGAILNHVSTNDILNDNVVYENVSLSMDNHIMYMDHALLECNKTADEIEFLKQSIREKTENDIRYFLDKYNRVAVIRPYHTGKTYTCLKLIKEYSKTKKCLVILPMKNDQGKITLDNLCNGHIPGNIRVITYAALYNMSEKQIADMDVDVVFMDEIHMIGGDIDSGDGALETYKAVQMLILTHPFTKFIGATATPDRMDGIDVVQQIFLGITCFPYTLQEAVEDGFLRPPVYYCFDDSLERQLDEALNKLGTDKKDMAREDIIKKTGIDINYIDAKLTPKILRNICKINLPSTNYMRFIIYCPTIDELQEKKNEYVRWFKEAFPGHTVAATEIHSRSEDDLYVVENMVEREHYIDLVLSCEMLCQGIHIKPLSGVIMDSRTKSFTKYSQVSGRTFEERIFEDINEACIFIDLKDNYHAKFEFNRSNYIKNKINEIDNDIKEKSDIKLLGEQKTDMKKLYEHLLKNPQGYDWTGFQERQAEIRKKKADEKKNRMANAMPATINKRDVISKNTPHQESVIDLTDTEYTEIKPEDDTKPKLRLIKKPLQSDTNIQEPIGKTKLQIAHEKLAGQIKTGKIDLPFAIRAFNTLQSGYIKDEQSSPAPIKNEPEYDIKKDEEFKQVQNNYQKERLTSKGFRIQCEQISTKDLIDKLLRTDIKERVNKTIELFVTKCGYKMYRKAENIDRKSSRYKDLVVCAKHFGINAEDVIDYVENAES